MSETNKTMVDILSPGYLKIVDIVNKWWEEPFTSSSVKHEIETIVFNKTKPKPIENCVVYEDSSAAGEEPSAEDTTFSPPFSSTPAKYICGSVVWERKFEGSFKKVVVGNPTYGGEMDISYEPVKLFNCLQPKTTELPTAIYSDINDLIELECNSHTFQATPKRKTGRRLVARQLMM